MVSTSPNVYLSDNFAPVSKEITAESLRVIGEIPPDLNGVFVRNGPNPQFTPLGQYHWFDGDGMLHGVQIQNGSTSYCNRYIRTRGFEIEQAMGHSVWTGLLEIPQANNPHGPFKNTANTALVWHDGRQLALWEGGEPYEIRVPDLATVGPYTYGRKLASAFTAHPKVDAITGEMMFFGYAPATPPYLKYNLVSAAGELAKTVPIDLDVGVMMHDFAVTEHYTIFMDLPLTFRLERMQWGEPAFAFEPNRPSRFGILPRHGDSKAIHWFEAPPCYVFHTLNAYEVGDEVVLVACRMNSTQVLGLSETPHDHRESGITDGKDNIACLYRWRFNLVTGTVAEEALDDRPSDFPRINEQLTGRKTQYGYTARFAPPQESKSPLFDGLLKYNLATERSEAHEFGPGRYGGEAVFVPRSGTVAEDDGWLLTFVHDTIASQSELVILNAQDMSAPPVARLLIPQRVPYGFHGTWISSEQIAMQRNR